MKSIIPFILTLIFSIGISFIAQSQYSFEIVMEGEGESDSWVSKLIESSDGNFVGKYTIRQQNDTLTTWDEYLIKITPEGDTSTYLFSKVDTTVYFEKIIQVNENPIQYFASSICYPVGKWKLSSELFILLDENFNIIWEKLYSLSEFEWGAAESGDIMWLADSSFLYARQPDGFRDYMYVFHLSADGDSLDFRTYDGDSAGMVMAVTYSPDSSAYWLHTYYANYDPTKPAAQVITMNEQLEYTNLMYYPRWFDRDYYAKVLPNYSLVAGGNFQDFDNNYLSTFIVDSGLNVLYEDYITDPDTALATTGKCVDYYYPDQIFVGGTHNRSLWGEFPTWFVLAKYNSELDLIYERYIGDSANYWLFDIAATSDSGVLLSGRRYDYWEPVPKRKAVVIKLNPDGILVGDEEVQAPIKVSKAIVYPNPGTAKLMVRTALKNCIIRLFDMKGTEVMAELIDKHITEINTRKLKPGTYIFVIEHSNTAIETGKWIKQ